MRGLKIMNLQQVAFYINNGVQPLRIEVGHRGKLVFIYDVESTYDLFIKWRKMSKQLKSGNLHGKS